MKGQNRKIVLGGLSAVVVVLGLAAVIIYAVPSQSSPSGQTTSWLKVGAYVRYDQVFQWNGGNATKTMSWNITAVSEDLARLAITSYTFNVTNGGVVIYQVEELWTVNSMTGQIVSVSAASSGPNYTGFTNPFWTDTDVKAGSLIDAYFGTYGILQQGGTIDVAGRSLSCWEVSLQWEVGTMQRWYDTSTGIVVKIVTTMARGGIHMNVTETATASNIQL